MSPSIKVAFPMAKSRQRGSQAARETVETRAIPKPTGPSRLAQRLAQAHHIERLIEAGVLADYAEAARALGMTRAALCHVTNLTLLSPEIQERILAGEINVPERWLRAVAKEPTWGLQRWHPLPPGLP